MNDHSLPFYTSMIPAVLSGRKTQTRRVITKLRLHISSVEQDPQRPHLWIPYVSGESLPKISLPYVAGKQLWVREAWRFPRIYDKIATRDLESKSVSLAYEADRPGDDWGKLRPAPVMPRWLSRTTIQVLEVRVQRLQDISEDDAQAEGVEPLHEGFYPYSSLVSRHRQTKEPHFSVTAARSFELLWTAVHGPVAWAANPWVAAISFKRIE